MKNGWLAKAGRYKIERIDVPKPDAPVEMSKPPAGVLHTMEGHWDFSLEIFRKHDAPHFMVDAGRIAQLVPLGEMAAALEPRVGEIVTNGWARAQIEVAGFSKEEPYQFSAPILDTLAELMAALVGVADIPLSRPFPDALEPKPWATRDFVRRHAGKWGHVAGWYGHMEIPVNSHWDPGALQWSGLLAVARQKLHAGPAVVHPHPDDGPVTPNSAWHAAARAPAQQPQAYLLAQPTGAYNDSGVRNIVNLYYKVAPPVGIDPLLAVAQMSEETRHLTSFWSQPPRRNPAGIGVTGAPGVGLSFPDWKTAVHAHIGRLLAFSLPRGTETPAQSALIEEALAFRPLPGNLRGIAPTLKGLVGHWATDPQYAVTVAHVANQMRTHGS
jgi:Mannosyl-glycoprotein endo-beta-N-acetylglucosaminidase